MILLVLAFCVGCDGHMRTLYFMRPCDPRPAWSISDTTVEVCGNEDLRSIVEQVANELHMKDSKEDCWRKPTSAQSSFTMSLRKEGGGAWVACLLDWPDVARSDDSKLAEQKILKLLKPSQQRDTLNHRSPSAPVVGGR